MKKNRWISLIGMPGSGKTTIAKHLSKEIGWPWLDTDHILEAWFGISLEEIKEKLGTQSFLKAEEEIVLMLDVNRFIVATGGSVVYSSKAMEKLKENGVVIYLEADIEVIKKRIESNPKRGLIISPLQNIEELYLKRVPLYEKYADIKVPTDKMSIDLCVNFIKDKIKDFLVEPA